MKRIQRTDWWAWFLMIGFGVFGLVGLIDAVFAPGFAASVMGFSGERVGKRPISQWERVGGSLWWLLLSALWAVYLYFQIKFPRKCSQ